MVKVSDVGLGKVRAWARILVRSAVRLVGERAYEEEELGDGGLLRCGRLGGVGSLRKRDLESDDCCCDDRLV